MSGRIAVFASGGGTNLQALLDHFTGGRAGEVVMAVTDREGTGAAERARRAGVTVHVIPVRGRPAAAVAADTVDTLDAAEIDVVALAGYLRLLPPELVRRFPHRIVNIHPALLPAFGGRGMYGARIHQAVLDAGCRVTGATVHFVNERYDEGRIIAQWPVPVNPDDTPETLGQRVLEVEHILYPAAVEWLVRTIGAARGAPSLPPPATGGAGAFTLDRTEAPDPGAIRRTLGLD